MVKLRIALSLFLTGIFFCFLIGNAEAVEFSMNGEFVYNYQYFSQEGSNGFFGKYDQAAGSGVASAGQPGDFAPYNFWAGWHRRAGIVSGSDAAWQTYWMNANMELAINPAIKIRGIYRVGEWAQSSVPAVGNPTAAGDLGIGDTVNSEYLEYRWSGVQRSMSPGYWNALWISAKLPWGRLSYGKRPSNFGTGFGFPSTLRMTETVNLTASYGPWNIVVSCYPTQPGKGTAYYNKDRDANSFVGNAARFHVTYCAGNIDTGVIMSWGPHWHGGGEGVVGAARLTGDQKFVDDHAEMYGGIYFKYNNARFFLNSEVDFNETNNQLRGPAGTTYAPNIVGSGRPGNPVRVLDTSIDHWRFALEAGTFCGPAKLSGLFAYLTGGDRRGMVGGYIGPIDNTGVYRSSQFVTTAFFRPYSYLINEVYGTGVFQNPDTTDGYIEDAVIWAGRLDYAIAANLNYSFAFMWADRASASGFGWGCIRPEVVDGRLLSEYMGAVNNDDVVGKNNNQNTPNIPETNIGYEMDSSVDWKLIEGMVLKTTLAYWQPGKWFNWACVDKNMPGWAVDRSSTPYGGQSPYQLGVNPNRPIDPVWGLEVKVIGEF